MSETDIHQIYGMLREYGDYLPTTPATTSNDILPVAGLAAESFFPSAALACAALAVKASSFTSPIEQNSALGYIQGFMSLCTARQMKRRLTMKIELQ
jgi:hypothetical protein